MIYKNFPTNKYDIIYADPPWEYKDKAEAGNRGTIFKYQTQSIEWIKSLPVKSISKDNSILFLWVTMPQLNICFDIIKSWGFQYKTCAFTWIKTYKNNKLFYGMGRWTRSNPEVCLLSTKGNPKRIRFDIHSVVISKIEKHSKKPDEVRKRIELLIGEDKKK